MTYIYWYSATGNSLYVAKKIAFYLGDTKLVRITKDTNVDCDNFDQVGFVFPIHYWCPPVEVLNFIEKFKGKKINYCFSIATAGSSVGRGLKFFASALSKVGINLTYAGKVVMPDNCIYLFNTPAKKGSNYIKKFLAKSDNVLERRVKRIVQRKKRVYFDYKFLGWFLTYVLGSIFRFHLINRKKKWKVSNDCSACGKCKIVCPKGNIHYDSESKKPIWGNECDLCMACINWCFHSAINYGDKTKNRVRYINPNISIDDFGGNNDI